MLTSEILTNFLGETRSTNYWNLKIVSIKHWGTKVGNIDRCHGKMALPVKKILQIFICKSILQ